ncbi:cysteine proteinase [Artomyces pyxidatus]|uniref:Cysteine proteinase n=1 Tax=Artomyces pyxidatus TaxID=48021 RepID=A0ACB8TGG9_9AGAM|nr:cysteine proteinase [Artomyces pyxidatus]
MLGTKHGPALDVLDTVGGPFASATGVFSSLVRTLGIRGVEVVEIYDIEPWAVNHLSPHGLIFCFLWHKDHHRPTDFEDPAAERVWFANQLSDDACASLAILNVLLNCPNCDLGQQLTDFRDDTAQMSPVVRSFALLTRPASHLLR